MAWSVFTAALVLIVPYHEPWFDEAQAWLIARDNSLFDVIFRRMHYEGTPALWHFLLWLLIKLRLPYIAMNYLSVAVASVSAAIFLRFAPFPLGLRVLFIFGYFPAYQYSIVARSYVLNLLLIIIAASLFPNRVRRPLAYCLVLTTLANTNAYGFLAAVVLFADMLWASWKGSQIREAVLPGAVFALGIIVAVIQAMPASNIEMVNDLSAPMAIGLFDYTLLWELGSVSLLILATFRLASEAQRGFLMLSLCLTAGVFATAVYSSVYHPGLIYLLWMFVMWISWDALPRLKERDRPFVLLTMTLAFTAQFYDALAAGMLDVRYQYSPAPAAAAALTHYLDSHRDSKVACIGYETFAIQPFFPRNVCANYENGLASPSFYKWERGQRYPALTSEPSLHEAMRSGRFQLIMVSPDPMTIGDIDSIAAEENYMQIGYFHAGLIWKDYFVERNDLLLFRRVGDKLDEPRARVF